MIGAEVALTGALAVLGTSEKNGVVLAVDEINKKGGVNGRQLKLEVLDDGSSPTNAISNVNRMIQDGVVATFGPMSSLTLIPSSPLIAQNNFLAFVNAGQDTPGTTLGPTIFGLPPLLAWNGQAAACYATNVVHAKRAAIITSTDAGGKASAAGAKPALIQAGVSVVAEETVPLNTTDPTAQVAKIRDQNPEVIIDGATGTVGAFIVKSARTLGMQTPVVGTIGWGQPANLKVAGSSTDGAVIAGFLAPLDPKPNQQAFVKAYQAAYGQVPDTFSAWGYDSVLLMTAALQKVPNAKTGDGLRLAKALEGLSVPGVNASYKYPEFKADSPLTRTGTQVKDYVFLVAQNGDFVRSKDQPKCS